MTRSSRWTTARSPDATSPPTSFQRYHQDRLPDIDPEDQPQLFEVLGSVEDFIGTTSPLNRTDFEAWLRGNEADLVTSIRDWLPTELSAHEREHLLESS